MVVNVEVRLACGALLARSVGEDVAAELERRFRAGEVFELPSVSTLDKGYAGSNLRQTRRELIVPAHVASLSLTTSTNEPKARS